MVDMWAATIDRGDINGVIILLDFRKAFDLINHEYLRKKLNIYQCDDNANLWCRSYLTGRTQLTSMNDLPLHIHNHIDMYADDSTLHTSGPNIGEIQLSLQPDLNVITTWCTDNNMVNHTSKANTMLITNQQRRYHIQNDRLSITLIQLNKQHEPT